MNRFHSRWCAGRRSGRWCAWCKQRNVVHLAGPAMLPMLAGLVLRKPVVVEHHGFQSICPNGQLLHEPTQMPCPGHFMAGRYWECWRCNTKEGAGKSLKMALHTFPRRWLCKFVAMNVTPTDWLATVLQLPRMTTIHHGILANGERDGFLPRTSPPTFGFVGRLVSTKGVHVLLRAMRELASRGCKFRLKIVGDGPERSALEAQTRSLGLMDKVQFLGHLSEEELDDTVPEFVAVVIPSLGGEVFGMVALESMSRAKPVIVSDLGALVEVAGVGGRAFASGDSRALAECLEQILESPDSAVLLGQDAQKRADLYFTNDRMISEHLFVYQRLVEGAERI